MNEPNQTAKDLGIEIGQTWVGDASEPWAGKRFVVDRFDDDGDPQNADGDTFYADHLASTHSLFAASADHKPRGVKPPLDLIPWSVLDRIDRAPVVARRAAEEIGAWPDGDAFSRDAEIGPRSFAEYVLDLILADDPEILSDVALVMRHGAEKYGRDNWRSFAWTDDARREYVAALYRHLYADSIEEHRDRDSGLPHRAHACACALILAWHEAQS